MPSLYLSYLLLPVVVVWTTCGKTLAKTSKAVDIYLWQQKRAAAAAAQASQITTPVNPADRLAKSVAIL